MNKPVPVKIGTFNTENLFMRYNFRAKVDFEKMRREGWPVTVTKFVLANSKPVGAGQIKNTAKVIAANNPDLMTLQEVENMEALKQFDGKYLSNTYPYKMLIDGNDPRLIDVAVLSKLPIVHVKTHQFERDEKGQYIFSRDCLEVDLAVKKDRAITLFVNHFKSKYKDNPEKRKKQAAQVAKIVQERFGSDLRKGDFVVVGDLNAAPNEAELNPLLGLKGLENVVQTRVPNKYERWTHYYRGMVHQLDYILLSPSLSKKNPKNKPKIERRGLANYVKAYTGERFTGVGPAGTEASDHCAVFMQLKV